MTTPEAGIRLVLLTYDDIYQWIARQRDGMGETYRKHAALICLSPSDLKEVGLQDGGHVELSSQSGSVVVEVKSDTACAEGTGHMPASLYSNCMAGYDPSVSTLPNLKRIEVTAVPTQKDVTAISDLLVRKTVG